MAEAIVFLQVSGLDDRDTRPFGGRDPELRLPSSSWRNRLTQEIGSTMTCSPDAPIPSARALLAPLGKSRGLDAESPINVASLDVGPFEHPDLPLGTVEGGAAGRPNPSE